LPSIKYLKYVCLVPASFLCYFHYTVFFSKLRHWGWKKRSKAHVSNVDSAYHSFEQLFMEAGSRSCCDTQRRKFQLSNLVLSHIFQSTIQAFYRNTASRELFSYVMDYNMLKYIEMFFCRSRITIINTCPSIYLSKIPIYCTAQFNVLILNTVCSPVNYN
jgi:hypothetical protein